MTRLPASLAAAGGAGARRLRRGAGGRAGPDAAAAVAACAAATAEHVGKPVEAVTAAWQGPSPDGGATVEVTDAGRGPGRAHPRLRRARRRERWRRSPTRTPEAWSSG